MYLDDCQKKTHLEQGTRTFDLETVRKLIDTPLKLSYLDK